MSDVTLKYKGATIGELSESGSKTLETAGKYCEADILLEYVKPQGGDYLLDLSNPDLWERKDFSSTSAIGSSYDATRSSSTTRISLKQPIEWKSVAVAIKIPTDFDFYGLFYDEQKNYIGWALNEWLAPQRTYLPNVGRRQAVGSIDFSNAKYFGIALRKHNNSSITVDNAETVNLRILWGDFT